jgi:hypothetical protein
MTQALSPDEIAQLVEFAEAEAYADLFRIAPPELHMQVETVGSAVALIAETIDIVLFNRVIGLGLREPATEAMLDGIVARYRQAQFHCSGKPQRSTSRAAGLADGAQPAPAR